jgi:hypothetical protein
MDGGAMKVETFTTQENRLWPRLVDLNASNLGTKIYMPCNNLVWASAQCSITEGTGTTWVLTVIVSNDPLAKSFENHPSAITLTNSAKITPVFSVVGYLYFGVQLTTVAGSATLGHIFLVGKDSPA